MVPLTVEDRFLIKDLRNEKCWAVDRMIVGFPARLQNRRRPYFV